MMFIGSPFLGYPTCLFFAHVVWWSTAVWTATTTRWRRPERSLTMGCITSVEIFQDVKCCGDGGWHECCLYLSTSLTTLRTWELTLTTSWTAETILRRNNRMKSNRMNFHLHEQHLHDGLLVWNPLIRLNYSFIWQMPTWKKHWHDVFPQSHDTHLHNIPYFDEI